MRLLIIDDEPVMLTALHDTLRDEGYRILTAADGEAGLTKAVEEKPDLILLDIMMPRLDGFALCRELRRLGIRTPVLMLTARGQTDDKVNGLDSGADDYLVKPFSQRELLARVRALLRRTASDAAPPERVSFGEITIDFLRRECCRNGRTVKLTPKEFAILRLLAEQPGVAVSRETFLDRVWGYGSFPTTRTIDNHIARLRSRLENDPSSPRWILTANKSGYLLAAE